MKSLPTFSRKSNRTRIATLLLASLIFVGATDRNASAADALTTAAAASPASKGLLRSLFGNRRSSEGAYVPPTTAMDRVNRSILGLPLGILRSLGKGVSRMASKTVTDHITHN